MAQKNIFLVLLICSFFSSIHASAPQPVATTTCAFHNQTDQPITLRWGGMPILFAQILKANGIVRQKISTNFLRFLLPTIWLKTPEGYTAGAIAPDKVAHLVARLSQPDNPGLDYTITTTNHGFEVCIKTVYIPHIYLFDYAQAAADEHVEAIIRLPRARIQPAIYELTKHTAAGEAIETVAAVALAQLAEETDISMPLALNVESDNRQHELPLFGSGDELRISPPGVEPETAKPTLQHSSSDTALADSYHTVESPDHHTPPTPAQSEQSAPATGSWWQMPAWSVWPWGK
jgi:hypothetical protein